MCNLKKLLSIAAAVVLAITLAAGCQPKQEKGTMQPGDGAGQDGSGSVQEDLQSSDDKPLVYKDPTAEVAERVKDLLNRMTLEEKIGQMIQGESSTANERDVRTYYLGSILSGGGFVPGNNTPKGWLDRCISYQKAAGLTRLSIPIIYGIDAVHGNNKLQGAVVFPHNIGLGAAADPELMSQIGQVTAEEMLAAGINWNFAPCIAVARDERWGRTYESFGESPELVSMLLEPYITAQQSYNIAVTAKHYAADGGTKWGTGEGQYGIDQGDAVLSEEALRAIHLAPYEKAVEAGAKTVMVSFSSWNGLKNHENKYLIEDLLKGEMGFEGFVVSDWEALHQVKGKNLYEQAVACINAGVDMLMEPNHWKESIGAIKKAVGNGDISQARIDDAVGRILRVKFELGLFENPTGDQVLVKSEFGSKAHQEVAQRAVRESLVLLKNEGSILPLKKNAKIFVTGPAANDLGVQCGGWTIDWQGAADSSKGRRVQGSTILEGFQMAAREAGGEIITDPGRAKEADVAVVVIGETPYAEGVGDDGSLSLYSGKALPGNKKALKDAEASGLPTVVILVSGRPRIVTQEIDGWDAFVAAWLPGTEGAAIPQVLYGDYDFSGKLPITWPKSLDQIPVNVDEMNGAEPLFPFGYGLKIGN